MEQICCREKVLVVTHVELFFPPVRRKETRENVCVHMCVCENLPTCSSCYTTVVNTQTHQKFAAFLEQCSLPDF